MPDPIIDNPRAMRKLTKAKLIMIITDLNESFISAKQRLHTAKPEAGHGQGYDRR